MFFRKAVSFADSTKFTCPEAADFPDSETVALSAAPVFLNAGLGNSVVADVNAETFGGAAAIEEVAGF